MEPYASKIPLRTRILNRVTTLGSKSLQPSISRDENYRTTLMNLDDYLTQPEEDRKIASFMKKLENFIVSHTEYYHDQPVGLTEEEILGLLRRKFFTAADEGKTRRLARNLHIGTHRAIFIRKTIAKVVSMGIDFHGNTAISLLPAEFVMYMTAFEDNPREPEFAQVDDVALCEWRRLGMFLLSGPQNKTVRLRNTDKRIDMMLNLLDEILRPFAKIDHMAEGNGRRLGNLRTVLEIAADFGVLLFGQPCGWKLDWTVRSLVQVQPMPNIQDGEPQPQPTPQRRRRRRRLGRKKFAKENISREEQQNDENTQVRSLSDQAERLMSEVAGAASPWTFTSRPNIQYQHQQHRQHQYQQYQHQQYQHQEHQNPQHPSRPHYQYPPHARSTQPERGQSFNQRSLSDSDSSRICNPEPLSSTTNRDMPKTQEETSENGDEAGGKVLPILPKDNRGVALHSSESSTEPPPRPEMQPRDTSPSEYKRIVYFPALVKSRDEYGCRLSEPIVVSECMIARIS